MRTFEVCDFFLVLLEQRRKAQNLPPPMEVALPFGGGTKVIRLAAV